MSTQIERIAEGVWGVETQVGIGLALTLPLRMTVLRDRNGLVLISPIEIRASLSNELAALGEVHTLVAPNRLHYRYLKQAAQHYPKAQVLGAPGLADKHPKLKVDAVLTDGELSPDIGTCLVEGSDQLSEVVLLHRPSGTLIVTDLVFNILNATGATRWLLKWISGAFGKVEQSRLLRAMTNDRSATATSVARILALPFDRVVPAHGEVIETEARTQLSQGLWWMRNLRRRPT